MFVLGLLRPRMNGWKVLRPVKSNDPAKRTDPPRSLVHLSSQVSYNNPSNGSTTCDVPKVSMLPFRLANSPYIQNSYDGHGPRLGQQHVNLPTSLSLVKLPHHVV